MQPEMIVKIVGRSIMKTKRLARRSSRIYTALAIAGLTISLTSLIHAQGVGPNLVSNGGFDNTTPGTMNVPTVNPNYMGSSQINTGVSIAGCGTAMNQNSICAPQVFPTLNNWTGHGLVWVYAPGTADGVGAWSPGLTGANNSPLVSGGPFVNGNAWKLWGPGTGNVNQTPTTLPATSPSGGNFIALDADPNTAIKGSVSQLITGLKANVPVEVTFEWAAAQAFGGISNNTFGGASNEQLMVSLCSTASPVGASVSNPTPSGCGTAPLAAQPGTPPPPMPGSNSNTGNRGNLQTTNTVAIPSHGFDGWFTDTFTFDPTNSSEVLSFLANGNPSGEPPIVLLDGVEMHVVPEPGTWALLGIGFAAIAGMAYRRPKWLNLPA